MTHLAPEPDTPDEDDVEQPPELNPVDPGAGHESNDSGDLTFGDDDD